MLQSKLRQDQPDNCGQQFCDHHIPRLDLQAMYYRKFCCQSYFCSQVHPNYIRCHYLSAVNFPSRSRSRARNPTPSPSFFDLQFAEISPTPEKKLLQIHVESNFFIGVVCSGLRFLPQRRTVEVSYLYISARDSSLDCPILSCVVLAACVDFSYHTLPLIRP